MNGYWKGCAKMSIAKVVDKFFLNYSNDVVICEFGSGQSFFLALVLIVRLFLWPWLSFVKKKLRPDKKRFRYNQLLLYFVVNQSWNWRNNSLLFLHGRTEKNTYPLKSGFLANVLSVNITYIYCRICSPNCIPAIYYQPASEYPCNRISLCSIP